MRHFIRNVWKKTISVFVSALFIAGCFNCLVLVQAGADSAALATNGNGAKTDVGAWYTTYNTAGFWGENGRFSDPNNLPVGYKALKSDGTYGMPDSASVAEIDFQIEKMADAGIDFIVFDLTNGGLCDSFDYGMGNNLAFIVNNAKLTAERIVYWNKTHNWKLRYAVSAGVFNQLRQSYTGGETASIGLATELQAKSVMEQFINNENYGSAYYTLDGKPLLILHNLSQGNPLTEWNGYTGDKTYGTQFTIRPSETNAKAGSYGWRTVGTDGTYGAVADDEVMLVCPGQWNHAGQADEAAAGMEISPDPYTARWDGLRYSANWDAALTQQPRIVMISSLNDYMEDTAVWPTDTSECKYEEHWLTDGEEDAYKYWNMTVNYINQLRAAANDAVPTGLTNFVADTVFTASSQIGNYVASNLNDGSKAWTSTTPCAISAYDTNGYSYFNTKLKETTDISCVRLYLYNGAADERARDIAVDIKTPDGTWVRAAERHNIQYADGTWESEVKYGVQSVSLPFNFNATACTEIRVTANRQRTRDINNTSYSYNFRLVEIEATCDYSQKGITGTQPDANGIYNIPYLVSDNYALGKTVTATANISNGSTTGSAQIAQQLILLTDGAKTTAPLFYFDTQASPSNLANIYFNIDLNGAIMVDQVDATLFLEAGSPAKRDPRDMAIDVKQPNGIWKRVVELHNMDYTVTTSGNKSFVFSFEPIKATDVRVTFNRTNISNYNNNRVLVSPSEIGVYYNQNVKAADYSGIQTVTTGYATYMPIPVSEGLAATAVFSANKALLAYPVSNLCDGSKQYNDGNIQDSVTSYVDGYAWYQADFTEPKPVSQLKMYCSNNSQTERAKDIAVDVLLPNGTWQRVAELHNMLYNDTEWKITTLATGGISVNYNFNFNPIECMAVRITANAARQSGNFRVREIELACDYAQKDITGIVKDSESIYNIPMPVSENYAAGVEITSSNTNVSLGNSYPVSNLNDGVKTSAASCGIINFVNNMSDITINFNQNRLINQVTLYFSTYEPEKRPYDYAVDVRIGDIWQRVAERHFVTDATLANLGFTFKPVVAEAIRVVATNKTNTISSNFRLVEIESVYDANVTEYSGVVYSDVNSDLVTDCDDLIYTRKVILGAISGNSDVTNNGKTDILDLVRLKKILAK